MSAELGATESKDTAWIFQAVVFWCALLVLLSVWSVIENDSALVAFAIALLPLRLALSERIIFILSGIAVWLLGASSLILFLPALLFFVLRGRSWLMAALFLTLLPSVSSHLVNIPSLSTLLLHPASVVQLFIPLLVTLGLFGSFYAKNVVGRVFLSAAVIIFTLYLGAETWITPEIFTDSKFRLLLNIVPLVWLLKPKPISDIPGKTFFESAIPIAFLATFILVFFSLLALEKKVDTVVFDESHGTWESVKPVLEPTSFGRGFTYTYSSLAKFSQSVFQNVITYESGDSLEKLSDETLFILKMPTIPLSESFKDGLNGWVRKGGRLLVVADHTNLHNTTTYLNDLLQPYFGFSLSETATFDWRGNPLRSRNSRFSKAFGSLFANGKETKWQTGTSLESTRWNLIPLEIAPLSFSEDADYSRQNRFGSFVPRLALPYLKHSHLHGFSYGQGLVQILLDSTPWSTFSLFEHQNKLALQSIKSASERTASFKVAGALVPAVLILLFLQIFSRSALLHATTTLFGAIFIASLLHIGYSTSSQVSATDKNLFIVAGSDVKTELLPQLLRPGEKNYSRIFSSMSKYGFFPTKLDLNSLGSNIDFSSNRNWLFVRPVADQLPRPSEVISLLKEGTNLTVLFGHDQATQESVHKWLRQLGLLLQEWAGMAFSEDPNPNLLERELGSSVSISQFVTQPLPTSLLLPLNRNWIFQSYQVRSGAATYVGRLNLSFAANEFTDGAIGDVWQGVRPSGLSRLRERQLGAALLGNDSPSLVAPDTSAARSISTPGKPTVVMIFENGALRLKVEPQKERTNFEQEISPSVNLQAYLELLASHARNFAVKHCFSSPALTECDRRFVSPDMIEWVVSVKREGTTLQAIELLHERSFSGLSSTWNVVVGYE